MQTPCPVCLAGSSSPHARIDGYAFLRCNACGSLHIDPATLDAIDAGKGTRTYDEAYWRDELDAARERSSGESQIRAAEAILYAGRPVRRFLDVGTGPGYLLDELVRQFPGHADVFHGVESFPPAEHSALPGYHACDVGDLKDKYDAGVCIEVVEHLTPRMLERLVDGLARISEPDALWLFNTSLAERTLSVDPGYLDPLRRGHIASYSVKGLQRIFAPHGFHLEQVPGEDTVFVAEFSQRSTPIDFGQRIYHPEPRNRAMLERAPLLFQAAFASARAACHSDRALRSAQWALDADAQVENERRICVEVRAERDSFRQWAQDANARVEHERRSYAVLEAERDELRATISRLVNSRTWKMLRPLRTLMGFIRRVPASTNPASAAGRVSPSGQAAGTDEAIVLAGGLGTRLQGVIGDLPKPLAPVAGRPFIIWLLDMLAARGIRRVILATGYRGDQIAATLGTERSGMTLVYSQEPQPLGTGGAIALAARQLQGDACFVLNGDTRLTLEYAEFAACARNAKARLGVALTQVPDVARYGAVRVEDGRIAGLIEKGATGPGYINAGVYWIDRALFADLPGSGSFSFETEVLVPAIVREPVTAFTETSGFIDIGVPEDYRRAQSLFAGTAA